MSVIAKMDYGFVLIDFLVRPMGIDVHTTCKSIRCGCRSFSKEDEIICKKEVGDFQAASRDFHTLQIVEILFLIEQSWDNLTSKNEEKMRKGVTLTKSLGMMNRSSR